MITLLSFILFSLCGVLATFPVLDERACGVRERLALGTTVGSVLGTWLAFLLFLAVGQGWLLRGAILGLALATFLLLMRRTPLWGHSLRRGLVSPSRHGLGAALGALFWIAFWWRVATQTLFVDASGIHTGVVANLGDLGENMAFVSYFAFGPNDLANPLFDGILYRHHFLSNFFASLFVSEGVDPHRVLQAQTFFFGLLTTALVSGFVARVTGSKACGWISPLLLYTAGGVQWFDMLLLDAADETPWRNFLITRIIPQRAFLLGLPLACATLTLLWEGFNRPRLRTWLAAGLLAGVAPTAGIFTFAGVAFVGSWLSLTRGWRVLLAFNAPLAILALPQLYYHLEIGKAVSELHLIAGWFDTLEGGVGGFVRFWFSNTGLVWPMVLLAAISSTLSRIQLLFYAPFAALFALGNIIQLTPDPDNNYNLLQMWLLGSLPVILLLWKRLWGSGWLSARLLVVALALILVGTGLVKFQRQWSGESGPHRLISAAEYEFAGKLREEVPPTERVLIRPTYNHPVFWSGRQVLMGYPGWVWSHGWGDYGPRERAARAIYQGEPEAEALALEHQIDVIVVGPKEREVYTVDTDFLERLGARILVHGNYVAYRVGG